MDIHGLYPIADWNCFELLLNKKPRTDNAHEGWRFRFNMRFPKANMSLRQFILRLQDEEEETWQLAIRSSSERSDKESAEKRRTADKGTFDSLA
uniref:Uncharacterized protein n=1 Tax=Ditylenchus dipsaci TaxID=166011 RepID=A0A915ELQ8_9BILA